MLKTQPGMRYFYVSGVVSVLIILPCSMKRSILFSLLVFSTGILYGIDYSKTDKQAEYVPPNLKTASDIARYLTRGLTSPTDKARAIYYWIAHTIRYDVANMNSTATYTDSQELVDAALKTRKGVCSNYAALFQACCKSVGVQSYIIEGYTRQNGKIVSIAHAWNAVKIDGRYYNVDATWAAGYFNGNNYTQKFRDNFFMIEPAEFIKTHRSFDPIWQFLTHPVTPKEFEAGDFSSLNKVSDFNYSDSIKALLGLGKLDKLIRENRRITTSGVTNALIQHHLRNIQREIATEQFNKATDTFNKGVESYNEYINFKNKQFNKLSMPDNEILERLSLSRQLIESAERTLSTLNVADTNFNRLRSGMIKSITGLKRKLDIEDAFMAIYIRTLKTSRMQLFYK